jgi:ferritin-like metal-binding protein YciE
VELGHADAAKLQDETLREEMKTDGELSKLATAGANDRAKGRAAA